MTTTLRIVPPCDELDPAPPPREIQAVEGLLTALAVAQVRLTEAVGAMLLHHDDGQPVTEKQRAAVRTACHNLRGEILRALHDIESGGAA